MVKGSNKMKHKPEMLAHFWLVFYFKEECQNESWKGNVKGSEFYNWFQPHYLQEFP